MLILLAPFLPWQHRQWHSSQGTFPSPEILQAVHSGNIYKSLPRYIYTGCIYPNVNIQICLLSFQFTTRVKFYIRVSRENLLLSVVKMTEGFRGRKRAIFLSWCSLRLIWDPGASTYWMLIRKGLAAPPGLTPWSLVTCVKGWAAAHLRVWCGYWAFFHLWARWFSGVFFGVGVLWSPSLARWKAVGALTFFRTVTVIRKSEALTSPRRKSTLCLSKLKKSK